MFLKPSYFLLPKLSKKSVRLARQSTLGPVHCYFASGSRYVPKPAWLSHFHEVFPEPLRTHNTYFAARQLTDDAIEQIRLLIPDFFTGTGWNLQPVFQFQLKAFFAYNVLPLLASAVHQIPKGASVCVDSRLSAEMLPCLHKMLPELDGHLLDFKTTTSPRLLSKKWQQWEAEARPLRSDKQRGGAWGFIAHAEHVALLEPLLDAFSGTQPVYAVWGQESALPPKRLSLGGMPLTVLPPLCEGGRLRQCIQHFQKVLHKIETLPKAQKSFCLGYLELLMELCKKTLQFDSFIQTHQPGVLAGCLEYNAYGVIASQMKEEAGFRLLNVQHGIVAPVQAFDDLFFDDYLIWNEQTRAVLIGEGYPNPAGVHVIGNPKWEALAQAVKTEKPSDIFKRLLQWKGDAFLLGAYTQALQGYSTPSVKVEYLNALLSLLQKHPDIKMLIKRHPLEQDCFSADFVRASGLSDRILILPAAELSLWESLKLVDLVTSVFSATLLEALYVGKPALAVDFSCTLVRQGISLSDALPVVTSQASLEEALERIRNARGTDFLRDCQTLAPRFPQLYRQRVRQYIAKGLPEFQT